MFSSSGFGEECVERIISPTNGLIGRHLNLVIEDISATEIWFLKIQKDFHTLNDFMKLFQLQYNQYHIFKRFDFNLYLFVTLKDGS